MEAQIADVADDITYHAHDVDDGLDAGLLTEKQLEGTALWLKARERAEAEFPAMPESHRLNMTVRCLLDLQVENVLETSRDQLEKHKPQSPKEVMNCPERIVKVSDDMKRILDPFRSFLYRDMYWHTAVARANDDAVLMMRRLFLYYVEHPDTMGSKARARIGSEGLWRTACDYVSGMTDRYAIEEYQKFGLEGAPS
jgi:dGTPase